MATVRIDIAPIVKGLLFEPSDLRKALQAVAQSGDDQALGPRGKAGPLTSFSVMNTRLTGGFNRENSALVTERSERPLR